MTISHQPLRIASCFLIISATYPTMADIYKCQRDDGTVQFSDVACQNGKAEAVTIQTNSALDSSAERNNIRAYNAEKSRGNKHRHSSQQIQLISDIRTAEHNESASSKISGKHKNKQHSKSPKSHTHKTKTGAL